MLTTDQKIEKILEKVSRLEQGSRKQNWVSVSWITELTGWSGDRLRQARDQGIIEYRYKKGGGIEYLLQSVPDEFKIKQTA